MRPASFMQIFKRVVSVLVLLALVLGGVSFLGRALAKTEGPVKNGSFLADDREYDVLFFGSSHVVNGIFPMMLWHDYGITSYNLGGHGASLAASYWEMRLAVQTHKPKVAVLDVMFAASDYTEMSIGLAHELLDFHPLSRLKAEAVCDIYQDSGDRAELLFPLDVYHNRWKELDPEMVRRGMGEQTQVSPEKGSQLRNGIFPVVQEPLVPLEETVPQDTVAMGYVEKFVAFCQENDIEPVLTYIPSKIPVSWQLACNAAIALGESMGAKTLNIQYLELIDYTTDWFDDGGHLNTAGGKKVTAYLGDFLQKACGLEDHRADSAYEQWDREYEDYVNFNAEQMRYLDNAGEILTLAALEPFRVEAAISERFSDAAILRQLQNLGVTPTVIEGGGDLALIVRDAQGDVVNQLTFVQNTTLAAAS